MSEMTIEDPRVESARRNTEQEKEAEAILASGNLPLITATFGLGDMPSYLIHPKNAIERDQAKKDMENAERWMGDREALYGFATGVLQGKENVSLGDRKEAIAAAANDPEYELAMKDPAVYFQRVIGGLAKFYEPRTDGVGEKSFTFARQHSFQEAEPDGNEQVNKAEAKKQTSGMATTSIDKISYTMAKHSDLPATFTIDFDLPPSVAFGARLSLNRDRELVVAKTGHHREVPVADEKAPAYYQMAASMLYQLVCNYNPDHNTAAQKELRWDPVQLDTTPIRPGRRGRRIYTNDRTVVSSAESTSVSSQHRPVKNHPSL